MHFRDSIRRILLVALDNLGDLVFASALTPPLHEAFPDAIIDVWCKDYTAPIARLIPHVTRVIAADPFWAVPSHRARPPIRPFVSSAASVRHARYDVALLSEAPWRTAAATAATGIPIRVGLARRHNNHFLTHVFPAEDANKPVVQEQARLLGVFSIRPHDSRYRLDPALLADARDILARRLPPFVALHPFAADSRRCVALDEWTELARALAARGRSILWIGTSGELDHLRVRTAAPSDHFIDQVTDGSLWSAAAALSLATLFVGHDSGPLHLANALGTPVVGVFAPGQPERTFPQGIAPSRMVYSPTPSGITCADMLRAVDELTVSSTA
jgi:ADP-heptose:LPS heptosyltransferase